MRATLARLEEVAATWVGAVVLFVVALVAYSLQAIAWPLTQGRDLSEYLLSYVQLLDRHPLLPWAPLFRTPLTGVVVGSVLDVHHGSFAEPLAAVMFGASIVMWAAAALWFGRSVAIVTALALLAYPGYALLFHELSSEPVMATVFAGFALALTRAAERPSAWRFAVVGVCVALLALTRPGNAVLLVVALFPLFLSGSWSDRFSWAGALAVAAVVPLAAWTVQNGWRYGDYALARGGNALVPFYQVFLRDKIVSPDNGPASRRLAAAVRSNLLTRDPYKSYGITLHEFFAEPSFREHGDLYALSDETWGWDSAYSTLRDAALEAIEKHPGAYASGALGTIWTQLSAPAYRAAAAAPGTSASATPSPPATVLVNGKRLPKPSEGQSIPPGQTQWVSRPDQSIRDVWTGPTEHHFVFLVAGQRAEFDRILAKQARLERSFPTRNGNHTLGVRLNQLSHRYPPPAFWLVVGAVGLAIRRPKGARVLVGLALAALVVVVFNGVGLLADRQFMLPVAPAFVLFGVGALLGRRDRTA